MNITQRRILKQSKLGPGNRYQALQMVSQKPEGITMSEIARHLVITTAGMTGLADRLEKLGLAKRHHSKEDRRSILIKITRKGSTLIAKIDAAAEAAAA